MKTIIIVLLIIILLLLITSIIYGGNYLYNLGLNPRTPKDLVFSTLDNDIEVVNQAETSGAISIDSETWLFEKSGYEDLFLKSKDNLKLHSFVIKNKVSSKRWAITVHGYTSEGKYMASYAKRFYDMGYNVIIPDLRGHGQSEGNYIGMGWHERLDIIQLINYITKNYFDSEIVLLGVSMGASTVMNVSGEKLPTNVKAIIEDCGYSSTWNQFSYHLKKLFKLPTFPMMHTASIISKIRAGYFISEANSIKQLKNSITPILFIHGDIDSFVPFFMLDEVYESCNAPKQRLIITNAPHAKASKVNPTLYWNTIENFLKKYVD